MWPKDYKFVFLLGNVLAPTDNTLQKTRAKTLRASFATGTLIVHYVLLQIALLQLVLGKNIKDKDKGGKTDDTGEIPLPAEYKKYLWNNDNGRENLGKWIEQAAKEAGRQSVSNWHSPSYNSVFAV